MSYQIRRVDTFGIRHPGVVALAMLCPIVCNAAIWALSPDIATLRAPKSAME